MKGLIYRNAYILIIFVPTAIYILSYCLFEINAESSLKIKTMILEAIRNHHETNISMVIEYKLRILWFSSSLLFFIANLIALTWSVAIVCHCYSRILLIKLAVVGLPILTLALMQIANADSESAMYNTIFDTTYQAVKISTLTSQISVKKVYIIIASINILATITPVFIMFAICSSISMPTESDTLKLEFFIKRMSYLNQGIMIGSAVLLSGIIHMIAWMQWPIAMFGDTVIKNAALNSIAAICQYWGISCSLSLICFYVSAAIYWQSKTQGALMAVQSDIDIPKWMEENGITISWQKHALEIGSMLAPVLAGSLSHVLSSLPA